MPNVPSFGEPWSRSDIEPGVVLYCDGLVAQRPGSLRQFSSKELDRIIACVNACAGIPTEQLQEKANA